MTSQKKLEEEIARNKDPVLRKQLQELLDKRSQRWAEKEEKAKDYFNRATKELPELGAGLGAFIYAGAIAFVIVNAIVWILVLFLWLIGYNLWDY